jgi:hypothetical protein
MTIGIAERFGVQAARRSLSPGARATLFWQERLAISLIALFAAALLYWPLWQALMPLEMSPNEPWNAWYADAALRGGRLYPDQGELIVNNYPPLSFYLIGLVSLFTSNAIYAGRLVSILSLGVIACSIGVCVRQLGGSRTAAVFGAVFFLATMARFFTRYVAINDPNMLALAAMGWALAFFLARLSAGKSVEPAVACLVLAGFLKHSLIAIPFTALIWLAFTQPRRGLRASLFAAGLVGLGLAICLAVYGTGFFVQLLMPRVLSIGYALRVANKIQWVAPALLLWAIWAWPNRHTAPARFSALLIAISYAACTIQTAGDGVVRNAFFELVFASGVAAGLAFGGIVEIPLARRFGVVQAQRVMIAVLILRLVLAQGAEPYLAIFSQDFRADVRQKISIMNREVERIRAIPGPVSCASMTVCYRAGKAFAYDPFWVRQKLATGKMSREQIDDAITRAGIRFEVIDPNLWIEKKRLF